MEKENKLIKNTLLYGITQFSSSFLTLLMIPVYTFYFTPTQFGTWDLIMTTLALLSPFITFELIAASYRWLLDAKTKEERVTIISTSIITICRNLLILDSIIFIVVSFFTLNINYLWESLLLLNCSVISAYLQQCARGLKENLLFALSGVIQSVIMIITNLVFMFVFHFQIEALFYSSIIAHICTALFLFSYLNFKQYIQVKNRSAPLLTDFLTYSIPIIPGAMSWWVMTMSDRYMITYFLGVEQNGLYAIANKIPAIILIINNIFFLAWKDSVITEFQSNTKNDYYTKVFQHFFRLITTSVIILTVTTKPIFTFIISNQYHDAWKYVGLLLTGSLFHTLSLFWSAGAHGAKKTKVIFITSVIGALINILVNLIFIPIIGLYAVGLSTTIAFFVTWLIRVAEARQYFPIKIKPFEFISLLCLIAIINSAPFLLNIRTLVILSVLTIGFGLGLNFKMVWNRLKYLRQ